MMPGRILRLMASGCCALSRTRQAGGCNNVIYWMPLPDIPEK